LTDRIKQIFSILDEYIPDAYIELDHKEDAYMLLVGVVLSAQSTDKQVNKATEFLFRVADTPEKMVALGVDKLSEMVNSIGLYRTKAKNIIKLSQILIEKYNSHVPNNREDLMSLPGVGRKSADVMLNVVYGKPTIAVDTHVFRVSTRLGLSDMKTRDKMSEDLEKMLPQHLDPEMVHKAHHLMVLHGRYTCKAIKPRCGECPLYDLCNSKDKRNKID
jgi:endonuclease III